MPRGPACLSRARRYSGDAGGRSPSARKRRRPAQGLSASMSFKVVIPARHAAARLPGKPLLDIAGRPMIQWVIEAALRSHAEEVLVATDDQRIADAAFDSR